MKLVQLYHKEIKLKYNDKDIENKLRIIWSGIKQRCFNKNCKNYSKYGEKGIIVCDEWLNFKNFFEWAIKNGYDFIPDSNGRNTITIDRIDSKKGYYPENCRWCNYEIQNTHLSKAKNNKSGYIGLFLEKNHTWSSHISVNNKSITIGCYKTQKEALEARNNYIKNNHLNHVIQEYKGELLLPKNIFPIFKK